MKKVGFEFATLFLSRSTFNATVTDYTEINGGTSFKPHGTWSKTETRLVGVVFFYISQ